MLLLTRDGVSQPAQYLLYQWAAERDEGLSFELINIICFTLSRNLFVISSLNKSYDCLL